MKNNFVQGNIFVMVAGLPRTKATEVLRQLGGDKRFQVEFVPKVSDVEKMATQANPSIILLDADSAGEKIILKVHALQAEKGMYTVAVQGEGSKRKLPPGYPVGLSLVNMENITRHFSDLHCLVQGK